MGLIYRFLRWLKYNNPAIIRKVLNGAYYDPETIVLYKDNFDCLVVDDCTFSMSDQVDSVQRVKGNPWFDNIRKSDTVLDIGANIGAITIPLAKVAKQIYAVEPLFSGELRKNIQLNDLKNVQIIECGLGHDNTTEKIQYSSTHGLCKTMSLATIFGITGKVNYIKVDCEGAEWMIEPDQFDGIREIRMEFHIRRNNKHSDSKKLKGWEQWLRQNNYWFNMKRRAQPGPCVPFTECVLLNASKRALLG